MSDSQELVVRDHKSAEGLQELADILLTPRSDLPEQAATVEDPEDISREILASILSAETVAEVERLEAEGWRERVGDPMEIRGFQWRPSTFEEGQAVFFVVRANDLTVDPPKPVLLTTGSGNVMAQLVALARLNALVGAVREIAFDTTQGGFKVYYLKAPDGVDPAGHVAVDTEAIEA